MFLKTCVIGMNFKKLLQSPRRGRKGKNQANQLLYKVLEHLKYCCADVFLSWDFSESVVDYCLGSVTMISDFVGYLQTDWSLKSPGVTDYMNARGNLLDFCRSCNHFHNILRLFVVLSNFSFHHKWNDARLFLINIVYTNCRMN